MVYMQHSFLDLSFVLLFYIELGIGRLGHMARMDGYPGC
jgi:hypothetical protein